MCLNLPVWVETSSGAGDAFDRVLFALLARRFRILVEPAVLLILVPLLLVLMLLCLVSVLELVLLDCRLDLASDPGRLMIGDVLLCGGDVSTLVISGIGGTSMKGGPMLPSG